MTRVRITLLTLAFAASLAACSGRDGATSTHSVHSANEAQDAHDAHDTHDTHAAAVTAPPEGTLWPTDEPLRAGMSRIEAAVETANAIARPIPGEQAGALARTVEENVAYIVKNCKLEPEPDAALHVLIGRTMAASGRLKDEATADEAVTQLVGVLHDYHATFDHTRTAAVAP